MPSEKNSGSVALPLALFAGLLSVLGVLLFFVGWVYRWAYFAAFQLQISTLPFPAESFLMLPLQVFLADGGTALLSVLVLAAVAVLVWALQQGLDRMTQRWPGFPVALAKEAVLLALLMPTLFWFARWRGEADAGRDRFERTTALPALFLVYKQGQLPLGRPLDDATQDTSAEQKGYRFVGSKQLFKDLSGVEGAQPPADRPGGGGCESPGNSWRLLANQGGWVYVFRTLSGCGEETGAAVPSVLAVRESGGAAALILSPRPGKSILSRP